MVDPTQDAAAALSAPAGGPRQIARELAPYRAADAAEVLNGLDRKLAARVLQAMPKDAAIQILNEPQLDQPAELIAQMPVDCAAMFMIGLHPDRRADVFRELPAGMRELLKPRLDKPMREALDQLL